MGRSSGRAPGPLAIQSCKDTHTDPSALWSRTSIWSGDVACIVSRERLARGGGIDGLAGVPEGLADRLAVGGLDVEMEVRAARPSGLAAPADDLAAYDR